MDGMRASRTVPAGFAPAGSVVLDGNDRLKDRLNTLSAAVLLVVGLLLVVFAATLRPDLAGYDRELADPAEALFFVVVLLATLVTVPVVVIAVHEALHGLFFLLYTRARPRFGFRGWYAYASAPGWYLSRNRFLVVLLGPVIVLSAAGLWLALVLPPLGAAAVLFGATLNAAASVGDLYFVARLLTVPAAAVIEDRPDGFAWHLPAAGSRSPHHPTR